MRGSIALVACWAEVSPVELGLGAFHAVAARNGIARWVGTVGSDRAVGTLSGGVRIVCRVVSTEGASRGSILSIDSFEAGGYHHLGRCRAQSVVVLGGVEFNFISVLAFVAYRTDLTDIASDFGESSGSATLRGELSISTTVSSWAVRTSCGFESHEGVGATGACDRSYSLVIAHEAWWTDYAETPTCTGVVGTVFTVHTLGASEGVGSTIFTSRTLRGVN